jgi:hypothetical protein
VKYLAYLRPIPGAGGNLNGECGGLTFGGVLIYRNGKKMIDRQFEECSKHVVTTAITFKQGSKTPLIETITIDF